MIGETIGGRYEIIRPLGEGGMGAVYEARQSTTGRRVALKMIHPDKLRTPQLVARFEVEARAAGGIESEHVVQVLDVDYDEAKKIPFLAMELLAGEDLDAVLSRHGKLPPDLVLKIGVQVCRGLEKAHERGILHRDIKPANLILSRRDGEEIRVKIVDFGLAKVFTEAEGGSTDPKLTVTGMLLGSPQYMSPEQARASRKLDARTDVWSLGMVLYELLTGRTAFQGVSPLTKVLEAITTQPVPSIRTLEPDVDVGVASAVERALELSPDRRYTSIAEMREALERHLRGEVELDASMFASLPKNGRARKKEPAAGNEQATVVERKAAAAPPAGAVAAGPTKPSGAPMTNPPVETGTERTPNIVIPIEPETRPAERPRRASAPAGTLISGTPPAAAEATTNEGPPLTEREAPRTEVFGGSPRIPAPPPLEGGRERGRMFPILAAGVVAAGLAVGATQLIRGGGETDDNVISTEAPSSSSRPAEKAGATPASATPAASVPVPKAESPLAGTWKSESGRVLDGVVVGDTIELRIRDRKGFEEQGYAAGEAKFTLRPSTAAPNVFDVVDHARPLPPAGTTYDPTALSSCVVAFAEVGKRPLVARLDGDVLSIEQAILATGPAAFDIRGNKVVGCKLERATPALATSKLTRQR